MDADELAELTGSNSKISDVSSEEIAHFAKLLVAAVRSNEANLTAPGIERAVCERIAGFLKQRFSSPNEIPTASRFTVKRPTKPGWYWIKDAVGTRIVPVVRSSPGAPLYTETMGHVNWISGAKWCGPIEEPH